MGHRSTGRLRAPAAGGTAAASAFLRRLAALALACAVPALAQVEALVADFSVMRPGGALPESWRILTLPNTKPPEFSLVNDGGTTVLRVRSEAAVGSAAHTLSADPAATPMLAWRWKVARALDKAAWGTKDGDDFAARVYVSFDVPIESLSFTARAKLRIARFIYGDQLPTAGICYVWDNRQPAGASAWNPYTDRVRMLVLDSGNARAGQWVAHARDVDADFRAAFGGQWSGPTPRITGIAASVDTDQTGESATAWFGDFRLEARR